MRTNKVHLYQFLIARSKGQDIDFKDFEKIQDPKTYDLVKKVFDRYEEIMIAHYRSQVKEVPGAADTFCWCHEHGIKVATDTGFQGKITEAIMDGLGWVKDGLMDCSVHVQCVSGERLLKVGDRIIWTIMDNCGKCYYCCEKGLMMKCRHLKKYGHDSCEVRDVFPFKDLVTHRVSLADINEGMRLAESGAAVRVAVLP